MGRDTGENAQELRRILDLIRMMAIIILGLHFYYYCHRAFELWQLSGNFSDRILLNIQRTGLFDSFHRSKLIALGLLAVSLIGAKGKKSEQLNYRTAFAYLISGLLVYFISKLLLLAKLEVIPLATLYMGLTGIGFILILTGGTLISRIIKSKLADDIFNKEGESFPQEERLLQNKYSFNLPARYRYKGKLRDSWINIVAPFRAIIVQGSQGSGKTAYCIRYLISQALGSPGVGLERREEPYTMLVYDFKFPDLSLIAYNHWLKNKHRYKGKPGCYFVNFDDLTRSHRGNVFDPLGMTDITDASESARTILLGLNSEWKKKQGDFFVESAINFVTAIIWFLRKYKGGEYCTLPHCIELIQQDYDKLFTILQLEQEIDVLVNPFVNAYRNGAVEQLEGQIASAKIALARLASPQLYYVLSGNDFSLDINNPEAPKLLCMGNNPQKIQTYGAVLSLYVNRLLKILNQKNKQHSVLIFDEAPTLTVDLIPTISTGRSNLISVVMGIQDASQIRKDYGREQADVILNTVGNVISGQVTGDSAKQISERIGKTMQDRQSLSINSDDTSISKNKQLEYAVPASRVASLSAGEFVGMVADIPDQRIELKAFHCEIQNDFDAVNREEKAYKPIPVIRQVTIEMVQRNYSEIKQEVLDLVETEVDRIRENPELAHLIINEK
ncbi:MAG TPA: conjugal transfer protein MobC [Pseudosphingobacterium sp.]|nr:conjugal transfer protein MobC [Pseudosphingobacterium sp.]